MIFRFALYGFLKNQRYFDPFLILFFLQLNLTFTEIGFVIGFRELLMNFLEIPSGALADVYGRRRCMCFSFSAYIIAFIALALAQNVWHCLAAMLPFAAAEAFRTGTHKAIIFTWLRREDRLKERHAVYGYTRSWSKIGSAVSIPIACAIVLIFQNYRLLFWCSLLPYLAGLITVASYPKDLESDVDPIAGSAEVRPKLSIIQVMRHSLKVLWRCLSFKPLRRLICESMAFEGVFKANKDYIQVLVMAVAVGIPAFLGSDDRQRSALLIGCMYIILHSLSAVASRYSHRFAERLGSEERAARSIWYANTLIYALMTGALFAQWNMLAVGLFILVHVLQNIWRPLLISRFDSSSDLNEASNAATILSVESQSRSFAAMFFAPIIGYGIDQAQTHNWGGDHWPLAAVGLFASLWILIFFRPKPNSTSVSTEA